jgi:hypothetical protein
MTIRTTITLEPQNLVFLDSVAADNRSAYINFLIAQEKKRLLAEAVLQANREEAGDEAYQAELRVWDAALSDDLKP